jgi:hypothetical protein
MIDDIFILDDFISKKYQDEIEKALLGESMTPWFLMEDISLGFGDFPIKNIGFSHVLKNNNGIVSNLYNLMIPMVYAAADKINYNIQNVYLARSFLQAPSAKTNPNWPHTDIQLPHTVCLYYVNDSDGDTILYNETQDEVPVDQLRTYNFTEYKRVSPKKGRAVMFNGNRFHSSSTPTKTKRCVLNFDI